jgi:aldehyde dehydrogenase (NAD+)
MTNLNYINGQWVKGQETGKNINPSDTNDIIAEFARGDADDVKMAVAAAGEAQPKWNVLGIQARSDMLDKIGDMILTRKADLGRLLAREEGKTLGEGIGESHRAGSIFKFYAAEVLRQGGEIVDSVRPGLEVAVQREPIGVIGMITPWNFPIAIPAWKIAPALAYGNAVVFKPAELVPGSAHALAEIIHEAGVPAGVFNMVVGPGSTVGDAIVNSPGIHAVTFTGSVGTGQSIAFNTAKRMARVQLEMGGKNPLVVLDDADMPNAIETAVQGAFFSTGQRCTASSRLIVTEGVYDQFVDGVEARLKQLVTDNALKEGTHIGPVVNQSQLDVDLSYLDIGKKEGATLLVGGEQVTRDTPGFYLTPALFVECSSDMRIVKEEIFGPVATVQKVSDFDAAMVMANDTEFGLSSGICTTSLKHATEFRRKSEAGMVMVNVPTAGVDYHVPFGGNKGSSFGTREQGTYAKEFYTKVKTSYISA